MKSLLLAASAIAFLASAPTAFAAQSCSGDFRHVGGESIADPVCAHNAAEAVAADQHFSIARNPAGPRQVSREQFCLGNNDIRTDYYCAPFRD